MIANLTLVVHGNVRPATPFKHFHIFSRPARAAPSCADLLVMRMRFSATGGHLRRHRQVTNPLSWVTVKLPARTSLRIAKLCPLMPFSRPRRQALRSRFRYTRRPQDFASKSLVFIAMLHRTSPRIVIPSRRGSVAQSPRCACAHPTPHHAFLPAPLRTSSIRFVTALTFPRSPFVPFLLPRPFPPAARRPPSL